MIIVYGLGAFINTFGLNNTNKAKIYNNVINFIIIYVDKISLFIFSRMKNNLCLEYPKQTDF
jgi:hypothetical protein